MSPLWPGVRTCGDTRSSGIYQTQYLLNCHGHNMLSSPGLWLVHVPDVGLWLDGADWEMIRRSRDRKWGLILMRCEVINIFNFPDTTCSSSAQPHATHAALLTLTHPNRHHHGNSTGIFTNNRIIGIDNCNAGNNIRFRDLSLWLSQNNCGCVIFMIFISRDYYTTSQWHWPFGHCNWSFNLTRSWDVEQPHRFWRRSCKVDNNPRIPKIRSIHDII